MQFHYRLHQQDYFLVMSLDATNVIHPKIILLMVQKSGDHQLRLVVHPIIYDGF